ncbi:MAG: class I SAM-dependent methyltransferase, partial [Chitinivibrionales bacterium]
CFGDSSFDFIVINNVLEHIANPIREIVHFHRILKKDGVLVLCIPDKNFVHWDKDRELTSFEHLWKEYQDDVTEVTPEHFHDLVPVDNPDAIKGSREWDEALAHIVARRDHCHIWTSKTFKELLETVFQKCAVPFKTVYESLSDTNHFEYFGVFRKICTKV